MNRRDADQEVQQSLFDVAERVNAAPPHPPPPGEVDRVRCKAAIRPAEPTQGELHPTSTEAQERKVLDALHKRPHTTDELRALGVFAPAARIFHLRRKGHKIVTKSVTVKSVAGFGHKGMALYSLG